MTESITFNGKRYILAGQYKTKKEAEKEFKRIERQGYPCKIILSNIGVIKYRLFRSAMKDRALKR